MSNELLDIYDEDGNFLGSEPRNKVHAEGLWHKTTHCWLIKEPNTIIFQMRSKHSRENPCKLYTTASGHVSAGEDLKYSLEREVEEELGAKLNTENAVLIKSGKWTGDFKTTDGSDYHDRVFFNMYLLETDKDLTEFDFQEEEVDGVYELPIKETLELLKSEKGSIKAKGSSKENGQIIIKEYDITINDFLINPHEIGYKKYGYTLEKAQEYLERK